MKEKRKVLVIDDREWEVAVLLEFLESEGFEVVFFPDPYKAMGFIEEGGDKEVDAVILDLQFDQYADSISGMDLLKFIKSKNPLLQVIILTAHADIEKAVEAIRLGAFDFIPKGSDALERVLVVVKNAIKQSWLERQRDYLIKENLQRYQMVGSSKPMQEVFAKIEAIAPHDSTVLITGESGTGKELVARAIHLRSPRAGGPFVIVDCGSLQESLLGSELFGHVKGAFTGAFSSKKGFIEEAEGGTIFLDEISNLNYDLQAKLLRFIETKEYKRIGSITVRRADVRIICATNQNLKELVEEKKFREDLYYRIMVYHIHLPPLRERREDIPELVNYFIKRFCEERGIPVKTVDPAAMEYLMKLPWKGNVRELRNLVDRLVVFSGKSSRITLDHVRLCLDEDNQPFQENCGSLKDRLREVEKQIILSTLAEVNWDYNKAAEKLKMPRSSFYKKLKEHGISKKNSNPSGNSV